MERSTVKIENDQKDASSRKPCLNTDFAYKIIRQCAALGITHYCVCPGGRNASLIDCLDACLENAEVSYFYDERAAAFYALGVSKRILKPVAIITTSGTAVGELLPAMMEGFYSQIPIMAITADRPKKFRGTGAPQTAEQKGIFGIYSSSQYDLEATDTIDLESWDRKTPCHINVCFDESYQHDFSSFPKLTPSEFFIRPFVGEVTENLFRSFFGKSQFPFILVGGLQKKDRETVRKFLLHLNVPIYCEAVSGLREEEALKKLQIRCPDELWKHASISGYHIDAILRIGTVPTHRIWRDLEIKGFPVLNVSHLPFSGLTHASTIHVDIASYLSNVETKPFFQKLPGNLMLLDASKFSEKESFFEKEPRAEQSFIYHLSKAIPKHSTVFLGNSLSIRNWDLYSALEDKQIEFFSSRGLNGIDGQLSTFFGVCDPNKNNYAIVGDLTALYDLSAPWILSQLDAKNVTLIVINNRGGKIFSSLFSNQKIQNNHTLTFKAFAEMWNLSYHKFESAKDINLSDDSRCKLIECVPDNEASQRFSSLCQ